MAASSAGAASARFAKAECDSADAKEGSADAAGVQPRRAETDDAESITEEDMH